MDESGVQLVVTGVNFRKTALEIRNKFALTTENIKSIYEAPEGKQPNDFFILSTCNRTEVYSTNSQPQQLINLFADHSTVAVEEAKDYIFIKSGDEAIKHLFHVASGLDSQIIGDHEIIGQLKNAFTLAKSHNRISGLMEKVVNASLQASRQVRNRTSISDGTTSISYAVIQFLKQEIDPNAAIHICLLGLGKIGTLTLKNLKHYLPHQKITLINRNETKAQSIAGEYGVDYSKSELQSEVLQRSDVLIVATGADHPIITKHEIESSKIKLIFDLSVPSNISEEVKQMKGIKIYDIDQLSQIVNQTIRYRENQIPLAEQIVEEHFQEFKEWEKRRAQYTAKN